jgi:hypothetical protein
MQSRRLLSEEEYSQLSQETRDQIQWFLEEPLT